jgi:putative DNA primase/helicase
LAWCIWAQKRAAAGEAPRGRESPDRRDCRTMKRDYGRARALPNTPGRIQRGSVEAGHDPLDPSDILSADAENASLAAIIDLIDGAGKFENRREAGQAIVAEMAGEMYAVDCGREVFQAVAEAYAAGSRTHSDILAAIRRQAADAGHDEAVVKAKFLDLVKNSSATGADAPRIATERSEEVRENHIRRSAVRRAAAVIAAARDRGAVAEEVDRLVEQLSGLKAVIERRTNAGRKLRVRKASDIDPEAVDWFWPDRISSGSLAIVTGRPSASKSTLTIDIAARVTRGGKWPDGTGSAPRGGVLMFGSEDSPSMVVIPRLIAAGADRELVRVVDGAEDGRKGWLEAITIDRDLGLIRQQLDDFPECRMIIFDPLSQYIDCEENSNAQTRAALVPLVDLARERNVVILAILHQNKKTDLATTQRIAGASAYGQVARHIIGVGDDPDDDTVGSGRRRAMVVAKNNLGVENSGQLYHLESAANGQPRIVWAAGTVEMDAECINHKPAGVKREQQDQRSDAVDSLRALLLSGAKLATEANDHMEQLGFKERAIKHAKKTLHVRTSQRVVGRNRAHWWSLLGGDADEGTDDDQAVEIDDGEIGSVNVNNWNPGLPR